MSLLPISDHLASAHALVKALKSSTDAKNDSDKLDLAFQALKSDVYIANKQIILREWVIETWSKIRPESLLNPTYHILLQSLPSERIDISALLLSYIRQSSNRHGPHELAIRTFEALRKVESVKIESWTDVWSSLTSYLAKSESSDGYHIFSFVTKAWRPERSLETRKKVATLILPAIQDYASARYRHKQMKEDDSAVFEILLPSPDLYFQILGRLEAIPSAMDLIPSLFQFFINLLVKEKYRLFAQPASSKASLEVYLADKVRQIVLQGLTRTLEFLDGNGYAARAAVWSIVVAWGGYLETDQAWNSLVRQEARKIANLLPAAEIARPFALEILGHLEGLDHQATELRADVLGWCIASPRQLVAQSEVVLAVLTKFHRLTRSLDVLVDLLDETCAALLSACASFAASRSVYDLIVSGALFGHRLRQELSLASKDAGSAVLHLLNRMNTRQSSASPKKRKLDDTPLDAAMIGVRSRLINCLLAAKTAHVPHKAIQDVMEAMKPTSPPSSDKPRHLWIADVKLAAYLRLMRFNPSEIPIPPLTRPLLEETIMQLMLRLLASSEKHSALDSWLASLMDDPSEKLVTLLHAHRLTLSMLNRLDDDRQVKLLILIANSSVDLRASELAEISALKNVIDKAVMKLRATSNSNASLARILPFASRECQETTLKELYTTQRDIGPEVIQWSSHVLKTGQAMHLTSDPAFLSRTLKVARCSSDNWQLLRTVLSISIRHYVETALPVILTVLDPDVGTASWADTNSTFFDILCASRPISSLPLNMWQPLASYLTQFSQRLVESEASFDRLMRIKSWRALHGLLVHFRASGKLADSAIEDTIHTAIARLIGELRVDGDVEELAELAQLIRHDKTLNAAPVVIRALALDGPIESANLRLLLEGVQPHETQTLLPNAIHSIKQSSSLLLASVVLESSQEDANAVIRKWLPEIVNALAEEVETLSDEESRQAMQLLGRVLDRQPFALESRELSTILDLTTRTLLTHDDVNEPVGFLISLFRHRQEDLAQHAVLLTDLLCLLAAKLKSQREDQRAVSIARLLQTMLGGSTKSTFHKAVVKHLPAVLVAYVRVLATSHIPLNIRRGLQPGLFDICDLVTTGGRVQSRGREGEGLGDAYGLGEGPGGEAEREVWADLWKTWANSRYVGQG